MLAFKNDLLNAQKARKLPGFQRNFAAFFVLNFCLREFPLSAIANLFEFRCLTNSVLVVPVLIY